MIAKQDVVRDPKVSNRCPPVDQASIQNRAQRRPLLVSTGDEFEGRCTLPLASR